MAPAIGIGESAETPRTVAGGGWTTVVDATAHSPSGTEQPVNTSRLVLQVCAAAVVVAVLVALVGAALSRRIAENQSVHDVAQQADILAESVVQPALTDAMATDTKTAAALGPVIRSRVLPNSVVRVKVWSPRGVVLYSDDARLIGRTFPLDDSAKESLTGPQTSAEISDLSRAENTFEHRQGKLLEVYRPVWTPDGHELLFETYYKYGVVTDRSSQLWRGFLGITLSSVAAVFALLVPIVVALLRRTRRAQAQREAMMQRALDASLEERQRIAAALHDGPVQQLAAASFAVAGGAEAAAGRGDRTLAGNLRAAAATVRTSMGGLRSLVVDIYPPSLRSAGLAAALHDMAAAVTAGSVAVDVRVDETAVSALDAEQQQAVFRFAQEALRNTVKHAGATDAVLAVGPGPAEVIVQVGDNGRGFAADHRPDSHLGISLMTDVAARIGARLRLRTAPGHGTTWRMEVPTR